jgi:TolB protein
MRVIATVLFWSALTCILAEAGEARQQGLFRDSDKPQVDYEPFWAPDSRRVVYISNQDGHFDVYIQDLSNPESRTRITSDSLVDDTPAWSPDGSQIVFVKELAGNSEIFLMNVDGTSVRRLTDSRGIDIHPNWSPDGSRILFNSSRNSADPDNPTRIEIFSMALDGSDLRQLTVGGITTYASWSPDGSNILARRSTGENQSEIIVMNSDGTNTRALAPSGHFDGWPSWSPDGKNIVFASDRSGEFRIYRMNSDGSEARSVISLPGRMTNPRWSPDGKRLLYTVRRAPSPDISISQHLFGSDPH